MQQHLTTFGHVETINNNNNSPTETCVCTSQPLHIPPQKTYITPLFLFYSSTYRTSTTRTPSRNLACLRSRSSSSSSSTFPGTMQIHTTGDFYMKLYSTKITLISPQTCVMGRENEIRREPSRSMRSFLDVPPMHGDETLAGGRAGLLMLWSRNPGNARHAHTSACTHTLPMVCILVQPILLGRSIVEATYIHGSVATAAEVVFFTSAIRRTVHSTSGGGGGGGIPQRYSLWLSPSSNPIPLERASERADVCLSKRRRQQDDENDVATDDDDENDDDLLLSSDGRHPLRAGRVHGTLLCKLGQD